MVQTLEGMTHNLEEILSQMIEDEFYYGYLGQNALSSSSFKLLLKSPKQYQKYLEEPAPETQALRDGTLFHLSLLEPDKFKELRVVDVKSKAAKIYKDAVKEHGKVYLTHELQKAKELASHFMANKWCVKILENAQYEIPYIKMIEGLPVRGKADIIKNKEIIDLKTTSDINNFKYSAYRYGYDLQAYLYLQLFPNVNKFSFIVIDKNTYELGRFECSPAFLESGKDKLDRAIALYKHLFLNEMDLNQNIIKEII